MVEVKFLHVALEAPANQIRFEQTLKRKNKRREKEETEAAG